jgi:hypothetical protein
MVPVASMPLHMPSVVLVPFGNVHVTALLLALAV